MESNINQTIVIGLVTFFSHSKDLKSLFSIGLKVSQIL